MNIGSALPPDEPSPILYIGEHGTQRTVPVSHDTANQARNLGYDFITTPITTSAFHSKVLDLASNHIQRLPVLDVGPFPQLSSLTPTDTTLTPEDSNTSLVAVVSPWIDLGSSNPIIAHISRQVSNVEIGYAAFCGINNIVVHGPIPDTDVVQYTRAIHEALGLGPYLQIHILLPMTRELEVDYSAGSHLSELIEDPAYEEEDGEAGPFDVWETWNTIRTVCNYSHKLSIALELPRQLPAISLQSRWYSEPIRLLVFPRTSFLRNAKGYPVLSKQHQSLLSRFLRLRFPPWILLSDVGAMPAPDANWTTEPTPSEAASKAHEKPKDPAPHLRYLRHLQQNQPPRPPIERFGQGYQDYLQSPLQPLTDNLESITYEVFEKDPVKYDWYERAIASALKDLAAEIEEARPIAVAVVGAGRGPLVTRVLQASQKSGIQVDCWAVEKNPNAFLLLQRRNATDPLWNNAVHVVKSDMRHWSGPNNTPGTVDILVSELLGSFADNELSPECLDGVQHVLHPDHGISIPQAYSAHFTPIASPKLYADLLSRSGVEKWELPYVVMLHQYDDLCTQEEDGGGRKVPDVKEAWSFSHPLPSTILQQGRERAGGSIGAGGWTGGDGSNEHNVRSCRLNFECQDPGVCHGLAGYFETILYASKDGAERIELSTNPVTMEEKSKDMISWFPIFFPLKTQVYVPGDAEMIVSMWRQTDDRSVWYEWLVEVYEGVSGKKRKVGMSELHSSRKNGCLM